MLMNKPLTQIAVTDGLARIYSLMQDVNMLGKKSAMFTSFLKSPKRALPLPDMAA